MTRKLTKALREQKQKTQQVPQEIYGTLIAINGLVEVPDRPSFVYVQLRDNQNEIIQAFNNKVASSPDLPVLVHREGNRYVIQGVNTQRYQDNWNNYSPYLPKHGTAHSFADGGGGDVSWIFSRQFMPNLVYPNDGGVTGTSAYIAPHVLLTNAGRWTYTGATGTTNLLQYKGTGSSSAMLLIYLDANSGNPGVLVGSGSYFPNTITGTSTVFPYIPVPSLATQIPLAAVRLDTGTANITWDNLYDVRQWVHALPSGTSSGGGGGGIDTIGFAGLTNGIPIGTGTILNVRGGATFSRSGTMFDLNILPPGTDQIGIFGQNQGVPLGSGTILNVNGTRLNMSISGTVFNLTNSPDPQELIGIYGLSGTTGLGTGTSISFGNGLNASITGTFLYLSAAYALVPYTSTNNVYRSGNPSATSTFTALINGAPTNAANSVVTFDTISVGNATVITPSAAGQLARMRLYNNTRGNYALVVSVSGSTVTVDRNVTTLASPWQDNDSISTLATGAVIGSSAGIGYCELEVIDATLMGKTALLIELTQRSSVATEALGIHPYVAFAASKEQLATCTVANIAYVRLALVPLITNVLGIWWNGTGNTASIFKVVGYQP